MFSLRPHSNRWLSLSLLEVHPLCRPHVLVVNAFVAPIPPFASGQTGKYSFPAKPREAAENGFRFLISRPLKITKDLSSAVGKVANYPRDASAHRFTSAGLPPLPPPRHLGHY